MKFNAFDKHAALDLRVSSLSTHTIWVCRTERWRLTQKIRLSEKRERQKGRGSGRQLNHSRR